MFHVDTSILKRVHARYYASLPGSLVNNSHMGSHSARTQVIMMRRGQRAVAISVLRAIVAIGTYAQLSELQLSIEQNMLEPRVCKSRSIVVFKLCP